MRRQTGVLSAAIVVAGLQLVPAAASAQDVRPCVSTREFRGVHYAETRATLEERWEVAGLGRHVVLPVIGRATEYPRCGTHTAHYAVQYTPERGRLYGYMLVSWRDAEPAAADPGTTIDPTPCPECSVVSARGRALKRAAS